MKELKKISPLRYPGGKAKLYPFFSKVVKENNIKTVVEPFFGGGSVSLLLLLNNKVDNIIINEYDYGVYCFWKELLENTKHFIKNIENVYVNMDNYKIFKQIYKKSYKAFTGEYSQEEIALATLFLNRTNRSGVLNAGVIGGNEQKGNYKMDCRFNKEKIIENIRNISSYKDKIKIYNDNIFDFLLREDIKNKNYMFYLDPPYFKNGSTCYPISFKEEEHKKLEFLIRKLLKKDEIFFITYDNDENIKEIYKDYNLKNFTLSYSLNLKKKETEILIFNKVDIENIKIN